jgi:hypothetical protein
VAVHKGLCPEGVSARKGLRWPEEGQYAKVVVPSPEQTSSGENLDGYLQFRAWITRGRSPGDGPGATASPARQQLQSHQVAALPEHPWTLETSPKDVRLSISSARRMCHKFSRHTNAIELWKLASKVQ